MPTDEILKSDLNIGFVTQFFFNTQLNIRMKN